VWAVVVEGECKQVVGTVQYRWHRRFHHIMVCQYAIRVSAAEGEEGRRGTGGGRQSAAYAGVTPLGWVWYARAPVTNDRVIRLNSTARRVFERRDNAFARRTGERVAGACHAAAGMLCGYGLPRRPQICAPVFVPMNSPFRHAQKSRILFIYCC